MKMAEAFKAISDPGRREILTMLREGRMNAGEISEKMNITPAALSYHLRLLKNAELVIEYKEKNYIYYELCTSVLDEMIIWIKELGGKE